MFVICTLSYPLGAYATEGYLKLGGYDWTLALKLQDA